MPRSPVNKDSPNLPPTSPVEDRANSPHTPPPNESPINRRIHRTSPRWDAYGNIIDEDSEEEIDDNIPEEGPTGDIPEEEPNEGNDPCPKVRRERDNALAEIDRLQTRIRHTLWDNNNATDELNERHQRTVELLNRGKMEAHWEIDRLGGVIPEPPSHQGSPQGLNARRPQAPRDDSLEDYVEEEVDPCDEVRRERDDAVAERDRLTAERNNLTLQSVLLQAEIDRLEGIDVLLERHEQTITRLHLERDAARLRPDGEEIGDDDRMNIHRRLAMERHATRDLRRNAEIAATTIHNLQGAMNDLRGAMHDLQGTNRDLRNERNATHREIIRLGGETPETPDRLSVSPEIPPNVESDDNDDDDPCREFRRERDDAVRENARLHDSLGIARINLIRLHRELYEAGRRRITPPRQPSEEPPATPTHRPDRHRPTPGGPRGGGRIHGPLPPNTTPPAPAATATQAAQDLAAQAQAAQQQAAQAAAKPSGVSKKKKPAKKGKGRKKWAIWFDLIWVVLVFCTGRCIINCLYIPPPDSSEIVARVLFSSCWT
jgi:hypothetical protein